MSDGRLLIEVKTMETIENLPQVVLSRLSRRSRLSRLSRLLLLLQLLQLLLFDVCNYLSSTKQLWHLFIHLFVILLPTCITINDEDIFYDHYESHGGELFWCLSHGFGDVEDVLYVTFVISFGNLRLLWFVGEHYICTWDIQLSLPPVPNPNRAGSKANQTSVSWENSSG